MVNVVKSDLVVLSARGSEIDSPEAAARSDCQRKSSRGAGAEPPQSFDLTNQDQAEPTLSSYLRDNSDSKNGPISFNIQPDGETLRVENGAVTEPEYLSEWSPRDKPWDGHRADADQIAGMYAADPEFEKLGARVAECSLYLGFAWAPDRQDPNALTLKLREAHFCRVRLCPICQWRRSLMWLARFQTALPRVLAAYPTARFVFLTLTQKNVPVDKLRLTLQAMNKAWERLSQRKGFNIALGWIRTTEVTLGKEGTAHPHFHVLLFVSSNYFTKNYRSQAQWVEDWRLALKIDYHPVVDIRAVKSEVVKGGITAAARETLKYSVKPSNMKSDRILFLELTRQLRKLRFISSGGVLKDVLRPEQESEKDLLLLRDNQPSDEKPSVFFRWKQVQKRYKKSRAFPI